VIMSFPHIASALGHSILYEEQKGDLAQARQLAEQALERARRQQDPGDLADALLGRGIVHLLQGEPRPALACFEQSEQALPQDPHRRLRATSYAYLAGFWSYNLLPDGSGAGGAEIEARWDGRAYAQAHEGRWQALYAQASRPEVLLESLLVFQVLTSLQAGRAFLQTARFGQSGLDAAQLLQQALQSPFGFRQKAERVRASPALLAYADLVAADLCRRAGDGQSAGQLLQRAWQFYGQAGDAAGVGACQMLWGDWHAAPFSSPLIWNLALQEGSSGGSDLAWTLETIERSQQGADLTQARAAYDQARELFSRASAPRGLAQLQLREDYLAVLAEDYAAAAEHAAAAEGAFEACGDLLGVRLAQAHRLLARVGAGRLPEERELAAEIGRWGASQGSFSYALGLGLLLGREGRHWLIRQGDYERALACYRLCEALYTALSAGTNRAASVVDQATVYHALGERTAALALYEEALDLYDQEIATRSEGGERLRILAIQVANEVYDLYLKTMDTDGMARSAARLEALVAALPAAGQLSTESQGLEAINQILSGGLQAMLSSTADDNAFLDTESFAASNLARSTIEQARVLVPAYRAADARARGDGPQAERLFSEALAAAQTAHASRRDFLEGVVLGQKRDYGPATEAFERYLAGGGADSGFLGDLSAFMEQAGGLQGQQERRRQQARTYEQGFAFMVRVKAYSRARAYLQELIQIEGAEWWSHSTQPWLELSDLGQMYEGLGNSEQALACYDRAIRELETRRHQLGRDEYKAALAAGSGAQYLYFQAARAALALPEPGGPVRSFAYLEQGKARSLLDLMAGSAALASASAAESEAMRAWRQANAQLALWRGLLAQARGKQSASADQVAYLGGQVEAQEEALRRIEIELSRTNPDFYQALNVEAQTLSVEQVATALAKQDALLDQTTAPDEDGRRTPATTALLQYAFLGEDLLAWAITARGIIAQHRIALDSKALAHQIGQFRQACARPRSRVEALSQELAQTFLAPLADAIRAHARLIIVPYGAAHALPFHALPWEKQPLAASHAISYLPSASALQFVGSGLLRGQRMLAVGDPANMAYRGPLDDVSIPVDPLPAAATEAAFVASLFAQGQALISEQATEEAVRSMLGQVPILHFATHGMLSEEAPLLSAILLAGGEAINVYELMGLRLDAELVVLSACRTALGEITGGDDVIGLTRGLLAAGARAAVVSLWPVDDASTSLLMGAFYRHLRAGEPAALALQAAVNYLRTLEPAEILARVGKLRKAGYTRDARHRAAIQPAADYAHPYYWAPFLLVG
jgi:CHAT domain-containing protein